MLNFLKNNSARMDAASHLDLKLKVESSPESSSQESNPTMVPVFSTSEDPRPFQFYTPTINHNNEPQYERPLPNIITSAGLAMPPTMEGLGNLEIQNSLEYHNGNMVFKRRRATDQTAPSAYFVGEGSGSGSGSGSVQLQESGTGSAQFQQLNGVGNVYEAIGSSSSVGFGVGNNTNGGGFQQQYYACQPYGGFQVGPGNDSNITLHGQLVPEENIIDNVVERRLRRMIKNRESAARSRARRLAYNAQLMIEIDNLKKENEHLERLHKFLLEITVMQKESIEKHIQMLRILTSLEI